MLCLLFLLLVSCVQGPTTHADYPDHWWKPVQAQELKSWEISPDSVKPPEVILSKRNELGILSNFAATPFKYKGKEYGSLEGFWQAMKYPEGPKDPRFSLASWPHTREQVAKMVAFEAKKAGDFGSQVMKDNELDWVSFEERKMNYRIQKKGKFYRLIRKAMEAKMQQNPEVKAVLLKTRGLKLRPDHKQGKNPPPAWRYHEIWMDIRDQIQ